MGDLTFPYQSLDANTETVKKIIEGKHEVSDLIKQAKKPMVIMGQSALKSKSSKYIFESIKQFLEENNKLSIDWNALNIIFTCARFSLCSYDCVA